MTRGREAILPLMAIVVAGIFGVLALWIGAWAILVPLGLGGSLVLFLNPAFGLVLLAGSIPIEAAAMVGGATLSRIIGMAIVVAWVLQKLVHRSNLAALVRPPFVHAAIALFAFACLSILWASHPHGMAQRLFLLFQLILMAVLVFDLASSWDRIAWVAKFLVVAGVIAACLTISQYFGVGVRRAGEGVAGGINRTATTMVVLLPFAFYLLRSSEATLWRLIGVAYMGLACLGVATTLSRMNFLVLPIVLAVHAVLMMRSAAGRWRLLIVGAVLALIPLALPLDAVRDRVETIAPYLSRTVGDESAAGPASDRSFMVRASLRMFQESPFMGIGYDNYGYHLYQYQWNVPGAWRFFPEQWFSPHGSHYGILANLGLIGFGLWLWVFASLVPGLWRAVRERRTRAVRESLLIEAVVMSVALQFLYGFYTDVHQTKLFWLVMGLGVAVAALNRHYVGAVSVRADLFESREGGLGGRSRLLEETPDGMRT